MSCYTSIGRCFEDAQDSGNLHIFHKGLKKLPVCVEEYDLVDVIFVDISQNRFCELPDEVLQFAMMESLNCSRNFLKTLPDMCNLNSLSYINISQNQLQTLPVFLCRLPLKIIKASHNRITSIPSEIGALSRLQFLDLSCNELTKLPSTVGDLVALRALNIHRNNIVVLPDELSKLKNLQRLDFSSNKVTTVPPAFRLIQSLVKLNLKNNPLTSPPAKTCMKGRIHLIKCLGMTAQQEEKRWTIPAETLLNHSPSLSSTSNTSRNEVNDQEPFADADLMENELKESLHEDEDNDDDNIIGGDDINGEEVRSFKNNQLVLNLTSEVDDDVGPIDMNSDLTSPTEEKPTLPPKPMFILTSTQDITEKQSLLQEKGKLTPQSYRTPASTPTSIKTFCQDDDFECASLDRAMLRGVGQSSRYEKKCGEENVDDLVARKEQLMKNKEEILESKLRLESIKSKTSLPHEHDKPFDGIKKRNHLAKQNSKKFLDGASNYTMRRFYDSAKEEFVELEKLRTVIEEKLRIKLPDDLPASLSDGIVLCHFVNHLRKGTIAAIHVPSSGVPKLTMPKCQMNVDAFLDACRKIGVNKVDICSPPDILEEKSPTNLCRTVHALLLAMGVPSSSSTISPLSPR